MKYNIGSIERGIRILVGFGILSLAFIGPASPWGYLGLVLVFTGLAGWCPVFAIFGANTFDKAGSCPHSV